MVFWKDWIMKHTVCALLMALHAAAGLAIAAQPAKPSAAATPAPAPVAASVPVLSSPIAGGVPLGSGAGVHSSKSPYAPLQARADVVAWDMLTAVKTKLEKNKSLPIFSSEIQALNQKTQRVQGFMMPLEPGEKQRHFLLSSVPLTCSFCSPGGPESIVEVKTTNPVKYSMEPVVVEGKFLVLQDDPYGLYYRITDAVSVK
jgi:uncharacterized protein